MKIEIDVEWDDRRELAEAIRAAAQSILQVWGEPYEPTGNFERRRTEIELAKVPRFMAVADSLDLPKSGQV